MACQALLTLAEKPLAFTTETLVPSLTNREHSFTLQKEYLNILATLRETYQASLQTWRGLAPIYIRLREFAHK